MSFLLLLMSSLPQNWKRGQKRLRLEEREEGRGPRAGGGWGGRNDPNNVCTYE
jgi:hypothetical protein